MYNLERERFDIENSIFNIKMEISDLEYDISDKKSKINSNIRDIQFYESMVETDKDILKSTENSMGIGNSLTQSTNLRLYNNTKELIEKRISKINYLKYENELLRSELQTAQTDLSNKKLALDLVEIELSRVTNEINSLQ